MKIDVIINYCKMKIGSYNMSQNLISICILFAMGVFLTMLYDPVINSLSITIVNVDPFTRITKTIVMGTFINHTCQLIYTKKQPSDIIEKQNLCEARIEYFIRDIKYTCDNIWDNEDHHYDFNQQVRVVGYYTSSYDIGLCTMPYDLDLSFALFLLLIWLMINFIFFGYWIICVAIVYEYIKNTYNTRIATSNNYIATRSVGDVYEFNMVNQHI